MPTTLQFRRGTTAEVANTTGATGELIVDTTLKTITVHDGVNAGGTRLATNTEVTSAVANSLSGYATQTYVDVGTQTSNNAYSQSGTTWIGGNSTTWEGTTFKMYLQYGASSQFVTDLQSVGAGDTLYVTDTSFGAFTITLASDWNTTPASCTEITATTTADAGMPRTQITGLQVPVIAKSKASLAYNKANSAYSAASIAGATANSAGSSAYASWSTANAAFNHANSAYTAANNASTDLSSISEDIIPMFDGVYDLGSTSKRWYQVSADILDVGGLTIENSSGDLLINADVVTSNVISTEALLGDVYIANNTITPTSALGAYDTSSTLTVDGQFNVQLGGTTTSTSTQTVYAYNYPNSGAAFVLKYPGNSFEIQGSNSGVNVSAFASGTTVRMADTSTSIFYSFTLSSDMSWNGTKWVASVSGISEGGASFTGDVYAYGYMMGSATLTTTTTTSNQVTPLSVTESGANVSGDLTVTGNVIQSGVGNYATESYVQTEIAALVDSAPATLDTLNELAAALGDDVNFATSTATLIGVASAHANAAYDTANTAFACTVVALVRTSAAYNHANNISSGNESITWNTKQTFGATNDFAAKFLNSTEQVYIQSSGPAGACTAVDLVNGSVQYFTANATSNTVLSFRFSSSESIDSKLAVGESVSSVVMITNGATAYYVNGIQIDYNSVTPVWLANSAPTGGNANSIDAYSITIIKTSSAPTYKVLASQTQFK